MIVSSVLNNRMITSHVIKFGKLKSKLKVTCFHKITYFANII